MIEFEKSDVICIMKNVICNMYYACVKTLNFGAWWLIGRFYAFPLKSRGFKSRSGCHIGTLGKSFTYCCLWRFGVKLWHSIHAVSGALLSSIGLKEVLQK